MKTNFIKGFGIIVLLVLLISTTVSALTINGASNISLCQCETVREVYEVCASQAGEYTINSSGLASKWVSIAPTTMSLSAGECKPIYVFTTPECYANSGSYPVTINVNGVENSSKNFNVIVEQCHTFDFTVTPTSNTSRVCEPSTYNVYVKNTSKFTDKFVFDQTGLDDLWVSYNRNPFVLNAGQELYTTVVVESSCTANSGNYPFDFKISNTQTNANAIKSLNQTLISFTPFTHNFSSNVNTCSEEKETRSFTINNVSIYDDEYTLKLNAPEYVSLNTNKLLIDANSSKEVILTIDKTTPREDNVIITLTSKKYNTDYNISLNVKANDCYNFSLERAVLGTQYCIGNNIQEFILKNTGTQTSVINLSAQGISSEQAEYTLAAGEERNVVLNFNEVLVGTKKVIITAKSNYETKTLEYDLSFENCYGTNLNAPGIDLCAGTTMQKTILVENNGTRNQVYNLSINANWIQLSDNNISVDSNSSKEVTLTMQVPQNVEENYLLTAVSSNATITRTMPVNLLSTEECYGFTAQNYNPVIDVNCCSGEIVELYLTNTGFFDQEITLEKISPPWVSFGEDKITITPGTTVRTYVYFSPPVGTDGNYTATVKLTNQKGVTQNYDFNLNVFGGFCGVYLDAAIDINNQVSNLYVSIKKDIEIEFSVLNDSNVAFSILDMNTNEYDSKFEFQRGINLQPGESVKAKMTIGLGENPLPQQDTDVHVNVITTVGTFTKVQRVNLSAANDSNIPVYDLTITGLFSNFAAPVSAVLLLIIILIVIVLLATKAKPLKAKKK